ncbi:hypothetical protein NNO07_10915 [Pseudomonas resinovorans]|uniref:Uncharacterized protein n=1 Tax=Metapseudomonas resinovorans TaxID=53412 RepID=A0ABT4Y472_METRE|nr:hypothetical protein [Pseudomonas resinovorans]MDA8483583.1 hypothetical protein [Pseudomonas resinovorans]
MAAFTDYLEDKLLRLTLRGEAFTPPAQLYVGLFVTPTGDLDGVGQELAGNGYQRIRITFGEPQADVSGATFCANDTDIRSPQPSTADWGVVSHFAVFDAAAGGNRLYHGPFDEPRLYETNDLFFAVAGDLKIMLS